MLLPVFVRRLHAVSDVFLDSRVDDELLADGVSGELPGENGLESGLFLGILRVDYYLVEGFDLAMIFFDGFGDSS